MAVRVIDVRLGKAKEGHFHEKKIALLSKEDEIEADFEKQVYSSLCIYVTHILYYCCRPRLQ